MRYLNLTYLNILFIDIETEIVDGFPEASDVKDKDGNVMKELQHKFFLFLLFMMIR
jgi:hypothetical protein